MGGNSWRLQPAGINEIVESVTEEAESFETVMTTIQDAVEHARSTVGPKTAAALEEALVDVCVYELASMDGTVQVSASSATAAVNEYENADSYFTIGFTDYNAMRVAGASVEFEKGIKEIEGVAP